MKRGIGKNLLLTVRTVMCQEQIDMVAGDFNGAAWRRRSGSDPRPISIIEEALANTSLQIPPDTTQLWEPEGAPGEWADVCGVLKPPNSIRSGKYDYTVFFSPPHGDQQAFPVEWSDVGGF